MKMGSDEWRSWLDGVTFEQPMLYQALVDMCNDLAACEADRDDLQRQVKEYADAYSQLDEDEAELRSERDDLRRKLEDTEASRDSWMNDFSVLATRMDKLVGILASAETALTAYRQEKKETSHG